MRKICVLMLTLLLATVFALSGCNLTEKQSEEPKDKVVIRVQNYFGGFGDAWLDQVIDQFESDYANFELDGKKGVYVKKKNNKDTGNNLASTAGSIAEEIFFTESLDYYDYLSNGAYADITDMVTTPLTEHGESKSIEQKMTAETKDYFNVDGKYYAIPFTAAYSGLSYDVDMFNKYYFYLKADENNNGRALKNNDEYVFITSKNDKKSTGPDGKTGVINGVDYTLDDGLPATYDEFFALCEKMVNNTPKVTPILWSSSGDYSGHLITALATDYMGKSDTMMNFSFEGTFDEYVTSISNGVALTETKEITANNGADIYKHAGRYYALKFMETIIKKGYVSLASYSPSETHTMAQSDFIYGTYKENMGKERVGMIVEGTWWENEANGVFNDMASMKGDDAKRENRNFRFMPLPKATEEKVGEAQTRVALNNTAIFINGHIESEEKLELCKDFVRYVLSDKWLSNFSATTSAPMLYNYEVKSGDYAKMTTFGKSVHDFKNYNDVAYPNTKSALYLSDLTSFNVVHSYWYSDVDGEMIYPIDYFRTETSSAETYFNGIYTYRNEKWEDKFSKFFN